MHLKIEKYYKYRIYTEKLSKKSSQKSDDSRVCSFYSVTAIKVGKKFLSNSRNIEEHQIL